MLVLSRKKQQSVVVECSDGFARQLKVTVLGIRGGKVKLGFDVKDDVPVSRLKVQQRIHAGGRPNSPSSGPAAPKEEMNRWEDDGGEADRPTGRPATPQAATCLAFDHRVSRTENRCV